MKSQGGFHELLWMISEEAMCREVVVFSEVDQLQLEVDRLRQSAPAPEGRCLDKTE